MKIADLEFDTKEVGDTAKDFLTAKRLAIIGLSSIPNDFSRGVLKDFVKRGYEVIGVNPNSPSIEGVKMYSDINEIEEEIDFILLMPPHENNLQIVKDEFEKGIRNAWFHKGVGQGSISKEALQFCLDNDMKVIPGFCPYMILPNVSFLHKFHHWFLKRKHAFPIM
ncbi:MAG: CoA-binding protein [Candidatus Heimdallarchaeota archaeon]|nr:CoA-binding protein [Candidatus Heimdallarchaeota archaeon]